MSTAFDYDLFVVGTGPAGKSAAIAAAKLGKRVGVGERRACLGGVCVNTGTIPSKTLREAILYFTGYRLRSLYGPNYRVKEEITMQDLNVRTHYVMNAEMEVIQSQMSRNGATLLSGEAHFVDPHTLAIQEDGSERRVTAQTFVLAPGTEPALPAGVALIDNKIIDSDGVLHLDHIPRTMTIVGGGVIGLEYSSMFATLGVKVTLVEQRARLVDFVDVEIADALTYHLRERGMTFRLSEELSFVEMDEGVPIALLASGKRIRNEVLLFSMGRQGRTAQLNLAAVGITPDARGRLAVNEHYQTSVPHIYAAGDVVGFPALASTSSEQGRLAALHACGQPGHSLPHTYPLAIYSIPEISMVGRTEEQLTHDCVPFESGVAHYREIAKGQILGDQTGMLKILFHLETHKILGVHALGEAASELIHIGQAVLALGGTIEFFRDNVFNYPTLAECYKVAAYSGLNKL